MLCLDTDAKAVGMGCKERDVGASCSLVPNPFAVPAAPTGICGVRTGEARDGGQLGGLLPLLLLFPSCAGYQATLLVLR